MNFLKAIAKPFTSIFHFLASPKGQALISTGEAIVTTIDPALAPMIALGNSWMDKALATEQLAATAAANTGTGTQKAALVMAAMGPEIAKYFPTATATEISAANDAIVAFLQAFSVPAAPAPAAADGNAVAPAAVTGVGQK